MTPEQWRRENDWKHGPRKIVVSERRRLPEWEGPELTAEVIDAEVKAYRAEKRLRAAASDLQLPETAGEVTPSPRRPLFHPLIVDLAFLVTCAAVLGALYLLADWMVQVR